MYIWFMLTVAWLGVLFTCNQWPSLCWFADLIIMVQQVFILCPVSFLVFIIYMIYANGFMIWHFVYLQLTAWSLLVCWFEYNGTRFFILPQVSDLVLLNCYYIVTINKLMWNNVACKFSWNGLAHCTLILEVIKMT